MKKLTLIALAALAISGCKKYPDGPSLTLRSPEARLSNTWTIEKVYQGSADITANYVDKKQNYTETFTKDGNFSYSYSHDSKYESGSGKWKFLNDHNELKIDGISGISSEDRTILRLKNGSFWYTYTDNGETFEVHEIEK